MEEKNVWLTLIVDNFPLCIGSLTTIVGVFVGGIITFIVQSRNQKREREWALDDQKRQRKINLINEQSEILQRYTSEIIHVRDRVIIGVESGEDLKSSKESANFLTKIDVSFDEELNNIFINEYLVSMHNRDIKDYDYDALYAALIKMRKRFNEISEKTFDK